MTTQAHLERLHMAPVVVAILTLLAMGTLPVRAQDLTLSGTVKNAAGQAVAGALVRIHNDGPGLGYLVVSGEQGQYSTPPLTPARYIVQAFGGTSQSAATGPIEPQNKPTQRVDLVLNGPLEIPAPVKRLTDPDLEKLMPDSDEPGVRHSLAHQCNECHTLERIVSARKTPEKWRATIDRMRDYEIEDRHPLWIRFEEDGLLDRLWWEYLAKYFGPNVPVQPDVVNQWLTQAGSPAHPNRNWPATLLNGEGAKYVAMEFSLPPGRGPRDIAVDSKGTVWVGERDAAMLGRFDPKSLSYTRIKLPPGKHPEARINAVAIGPQDHVWFADDGPNGRILEYKPESGEFKSYEIPEFRWPVSDGGWARTVALRFLDGMVWASGETSDRILRLDPSTGKVMDYSVPRGSSPFGLAIGPEKTIWYSGLIGNSVVKLDPKNGRLEPHNVRTDRSELKLLAADSHLNLWAAATESGKLVRVDGKTGDVVEIDVPTQDSGPFAIDIDSRRDLVWLSEIYKDRLARYDPVQNTFLEFALPIADADVRRISVDPTNPDRVWFVGARSDRFGYVEVK